uniref:Uncharacterized protein LOC100377551 n=1 Tax=Saccoglossus kowalevskii TaxID=10224 RepID=A0ABM0H1T8_SACKO|nr:PREDICTED: uncharacterized protein LOC100377551 [Saccoglossus kowalevskii]
MLQKKGNQQRKDSISYETLVTMEMKLEPPDGTKFSWEQNSITISAVNTVDESVQEKIWNHIKRAFSHPVAPLVEENIDEKNASREVIAANVIHQSDQILRKCIAEEMNKRKVSGKLTKSALKELGTQLSVLKNRILDDIRNQKIQLDIDTTDFISDLQNHVTAIFLKNVGS